jgi:multidrug efflux system membrane fusion protein
MSSPLPSLAWRRPLRAALALGLLAAACVIAYTLWAQKPARAAAAAVTARVPVSVVNADRQDLPIRLASIGTVQPLNMVNVKVRVDGELQRVNFVEGQDVKAGDLLAQIDPRPFEAQARQAQANLQKDEAQLANARAELSRYTSLAGLGAAPSQNVDTLKSQVAALEATVLADRALYDTAHLQLSFTTIRSPIAGRVGMRQIDPGSLVHASDASGLVTVTQVQPVSVVFSLPQDALPEILAQQARGKLAVSIYTRDGTRSLSEGELQFIDSQVDTATGQIRLKASFANADRALWPGELVSARLLLRTQRDAVVIPARALMTGARGTYVYVVGGDHTASVRAVTAGPSVDGQASIASGLEAGETVVLDGQVRLSPGSKVEAKRAEKVKAASAS